MILKQATVTSVWCLPEFELFWHRKSAIDLILGDAYTQPLLEIKSADVPVLGWGSALQP